ncbi:apses-domain-containing protein [Basidiobolus meristosporus CBS 931.73]|uniref:Apses-domain-containing protein n=1 Tax=Basidiobolus meristosporus CBS 931.73 TaxID=1314790 RepID=A0A1Y1XSQ2_9FUNG|nr:apses-domain-containing protein [Basidiobolus meristosporus CBS 931.73]|eukprot:ORX88771.1 apses-domain-containing protein [Basidiobolus meristosporus CBS 931.73]
MSTSSNIYSAVYSGVSVYEMICRGIAVMRRRSDSYLNATQILKVAGIDKGKRTKILEREVLNGEHEKVQGGYGKYQGTWIPFERGLELAEQYEVEPLLHPLLYYNPTANGSKDRTPTKEQAREQALAANKATMGNIGNVQKKKRNSPIPPTPSPVIKRSRAQSSSRSVSRISPTPSPLPSLQPLEDSPLSTPSNIRNHDLPKKRHKYVSNVGSPLVNSPTVDDIPSSSLPDAGIHGIDTNYNSDAERYRKALMGVFMGGNALELPSILTDASPPPNFDVDMVIDEHGHSALHWAAALGQIPILERLFQMGANPLRTNHSGETGLIRAVLVTNNYDRQTFPELLRYFKDTFALVDHKHRTVFHHIALTASIKGRVEATKYYMETLLEWMAKNKLQVANLIDVQDRKGDTPLNIAARLGTQSLIRQLLKAGASPDIPNRAGVKPRDFGILDTAQGDHSGIMQQSTSNNALDVFTPSRPGSELVNVVQKMVTELETAFTTEINSKKQELIDAKKQLQTATKELSEARKKIDQLQHQVQEFEETQSKMTYLEKAIHKEAERIQPLKKQLANINELKPKIEPVPAQFNFPRTPETPSNVRDRIHQAESGLSYEQQLEREIGHLRSRLAAYAKNDAELRHEVDEMRHRSTEKEQQCKKLIAACCGVPVTEVDTLLGSLIKAIESDQEVDLQMIGRFMADVRKEGFVGDKRTHSPSP